MTHAGLWVPDKHLNTNLTGLTTSATIAIQQLCRDLAGEGRQIFRLGLGQSPFPVPAPVVKALQDNAHQKDYLPVKGLPELRESISTWLHQRFQLASAPDPETGYGAWMLPGLRWATEQGDGASLRSEVEALRRELRGRRSE